MDTSRFDGELANSLAALTRTIGQERAGLYLDGHGCVCNNKSLCAHHAYINQKLIDAIKALELAGFEAKRQQ